MKKIGTFAKIIIISGVILFGVIAFVLIRANQTVVAVVPAEDIPVNALISDASMLQKINIPANTPRGYITDEASLIGQRLKVGVKKNQLLYVGDIMDSWNDKIGSNSIPKDYVVTSIQIPNSRAVGGQISAGNTVDVLGVPNQNYATTDKSTMANNLGAIAQNSYGAQGINVYWILANVKILNTSAVGSSNSGAATVSGVTASMNGSTQASSDENFYTVALSYDDYKKLVLAQQYLNLWFNISPAQNATDGAKLDEMGKSVITSIQDSQKQSQLDWNTTSSSTSSSSTSSSMSSSGASSYASKSTSSGK
jgi:Flp pilus assembly protein CpaB